LVRREGMQENMKANVVSLQAWKEAKVIEENLDLGLVYQSLIGCHHGEKTKDEMDYCVVVYSIPAEDFPEEGFFYDSEETELFTVIKDRHMGEFSPMDSPGVERFEIYDMNTDDVHIMYRIPFKPPNLKDYSGV
jgi:hypothetical protein